MKLIGSAAYLMGRAGARRIRFVESSWASAGPLEDAMLDSGWNVRQLVSAAQGVEATTPVGVSANVPALADGALVALAFVIIAVALIRLRGK